MKSIFSSLIFFALAESGLAQDSSSFNKIGNGGDVVQCSSKITLLDFYEHSVDLSAFDTASSDEYKLAQQRLDRLEKVAPRLWKQYSSRLLTIQPEIDFVDSVRLTDIPDSKHLFEPKEKTCKVKQLAIRKSEVLDGEKRFFVNKSIWKELSPANKAGLLIHEIIYEHLIKLGEKDSIKARRLTALLFKGDLDGKTFWTLIKDLRLPIYP